MPSTPQQITPSSNVYLDAIQWGGWKWDDGGSAETNITYFFDQGAPIWSPNWALIVQYPNFGTVTKRAPFEAHCNDGPM